MNPLASSITICPTSCLQQLQFNEQTAEEVGFSNYSYWRSTLRTFLKSPLIRVMLIVVTLLVAFTFLYPMISDIDPYSVSLSASDWNLPISAEHPFGTDGVGRDICARVWYGTRTSFILAAVVAVMQVGIGVILGSIWGYNKRLGSSVLRHLQYHYQHPFDHLPGAHRLYHPPGLLDHYHRAGVERMDYRGALVSQPHSGAARGRLQRRLPLPQNPDAPHHLAQHRPSHHEPDYHGRGADHPVLHRL